ncbi:sporulation protein [Virgibacillus oceani]
MNSIDHTLKYLIEALSNYRANKLCQSVIAKLEKNNYKSEEMFVKALDEEETTYLNDVLENELAYAKRVQYDERVKELTEVYELLF